MINKTDKTSLIQPDHIGLLLLRGQISMVDTEDYNNFMHRRWYVATNGYVVSYNLKSRKIEKLHRVIMTPPADKYVDHINGDKLDNRRINLRVCTYLQNSHNSRPYKIASSKYKGVSWHKSCKKWVANIRKPYDKLIYLGCFDDEIKAAIAYDIAAHNYFGEFAWLNFPERIKNV